jgi:ribosomal protein S18 acetylase RimI-like enzyme
MVIRPLSRHDGRQVAQLHIEGQPGTFLTNLGEEFLAVLYEEIIGSPWGLGVAALEGDLMVGVAVITTSTRELFEHIKFKRSWRLLWPLLKQLVKKPGLVYNALQSLRYPQKMRATIETKKEESADDRRAEYLFLGVRKEFRRQRIGLQVFEASVEECRQHGVSRLVALVDSENRRLKTGASKYAIRYNWRLLRTIELHGREMDVVSLDLDHPLESSPAGAEQEVADQPGDDSNDLPGE